MGTTTRVDPAKTTNLRHSTTLSQRHGGAKAGGGRTGIIIGVVVVAVIAVIVLISM